MLCLMTDDLDRSTRPRRPAHYSRRLGEDRGKEQVETDGMGWDGRSVDTYDCELLRVPGCHCHRPRRRPPVVVSYARPASGSFIHSFIHVAQDTGTGHRSAFLLRLSVGGYGASAMPCPRRKIKLNFYTILAILEKPSLWSCSICTRRIYFPWPM
jgi:hypothetical protein